MLRIEPWAYLRDVLCLVPGWNHRQILDLAPVNWAARAARSDVQAALGANIYRRVTLLDARRSDTVAQHLTAAQQPVAKGGSPFENLRASGNS